MKIIDKQYKRLYKDRHYYFYTRVILLGFLTFGRKFYGFTSSNEAKNANLHLEACGYKYNYE